MVLATCLALGAAMLHAGWNLVVKTAGDRFAALWAQFAIAGAGCAVLLVVLGGIPTRGWIWAAASGAVHVVYVEQLARAYDAGDFSVVYPIARGGGAAVGAIGGIVLLGDSLDPVSLAAILLVTAGLAALAGTGRTIGGRAPDQRSLASAGMVAMAIGVYSVADAHGIRSTGTARYALATFVAAGAAVTLHGLAQGRRRRMAAAMGDHWRRSALVALAVTVTYTMVQLAFERAPVGYVTALRESSVLIAAVAGQKLLGEGIGDRRAGAAAVILIGLVMLVVAQK